ncbi:hypothetical protein KC660_02170 [Candidatus Dojkabacteria bacterium]|uniref:Uncharacterized protein n=1 Tax=Candidatus Dojkabacteria bacterium TaxID=2099670 RepID=A0A955L3D1_9BACT|nr:hypothetical protein [Candidatus Dojkabacteria bacterium]
MSTEASISPMATPIGGVSFRTVFESLVNTISPNLPDTNVLKTTKESARSYATDALLKIAGQTLNDGIAEFRDNYPASMEDLANRIRTPEASSYDSFRNALMFSAGSRLQRFGRQILARITWGLADFGGKIGSSFLDHWSGNKFEAPIVNRTAGNIREILVSLAVRAIKPLEPKTPISQE